MGKTDNHNLDAKLDLRRHFLRRYHASGANVFDAFQGSGKIWSTLRNEFSVSGYWGVDVKPKRGRLKIDSARVLDQPGWPFDVIDLDAYGLPWKHYRAVLTHGRRDLTIFLTVGSLTMGGSGLSNELRSILGITLNGIPNAVSAKINEGFTKYCLGGCWDIGYQSSECIEALNRGGNARYFGIRLKHTGPT